MMWSDCPGIEATDECERLRHEADPRTRIAELEAALAPFARFDTEDWSDDMRAFADDPTLTMRHFRAAKAALQKSTR